MTWIRGLDCANHAVARPSAQPASRTTAPSLSSRCAAHTATLWAMVVLIARSNSLPCASSATLFSRLLLQVSDERESSGACAHLVEGRRPSAFVAFQARVEQQICLLDATAK